MTASQHSRRQLARGDRVMYFYYIECIVMTFVPPDCTLRLRCCTCSAKCHRSVSSNRKVRSTATRTFSQLKQSQLVCGPQFEFSVWSRGGGGGGGGGGSPETPQTPPAYAPVYVRMYIRNTSPIPPTAFQ